MTASSLIHTFTIITRDFIHNTTQRFHLDRKMFTITSQECKSAPVSLGAVSLSGQIRNRTRDSMKIPSTSDNLIRSKLSPQLMFSQDDKARRRRDVGEILNRFPFFGSHTTDVESETVKKSNRGGGRRRLGFFYFVTINIARYWNRPFTKCRCGQWWFSWGSRLCLGPLRRVGGRGPTVGVWRTKRKWLYVRRSSSLCKWVVLDQLQIKRM